MDDEDLRDLQERVQLIEEMAATPGWRMLADRAAATLGIRQQALLHGSPRDFTAYQKEVSFLDGASFILGLPGRVRAELDDEMELRLEAAEAEEEAA